MASKIDRRSFLQLFTTAAVAVPALFAMRKVFAAPAAKGPPAGAKKPVEETNPMARALGYKADATKVDTTRFKKYKPGQGCRNCAQFTKLNDNWGNCKIISAGTVNINGWCSSFLEKKPAAPAA